MKKLKVKLPRKRKKHFIKTFGWGEYFMFTLIGKSDLEEGKLFVLKRNYIVFDKKNRKLFKIY